MSSSQRILFGASRPFLGSGLFHAAVWLAAGVLFLSLTWVLGLLPQTHRLTRQAALFAVLLIAEVALIDMQQWRGVPSHFNDATAFDSAVFRAIGLLILSASVFIAIWTRSLFRHQLPTSPAYALAARAGMLLLNVGNLVGLVIAVTEATLLKPLHGAALHAIQALPVAIWVLARLGYPRAWHDASRSSRWPSSLGWLHR